MENAQRSSLRNMVLTIDAVLADMIKAPPGAPHESALAQLQLEWAKLVGVLALGPAPETRVCPRCGTTVMSAATRCGYCWTALPPIGKNGT